MKQWMAQSFVGYSSGIFAISFGIMAFSLNGISFDNSNLYTTNFQTAATVTIPPAFVVTHIATPIPLKAIYMSSWVAGSEKLRSGLVKIMDDTEINAVAIDIKDYTGRISFNVEDPALIKESSVEKRIPDIKEFIGLLHEKGIYVIGRISTFQDSFFVNAHPEYAVKTKTGTVWGDRKGVKWLDAGAQPVWDYLTAIGKESYAAGFDELNFDYIRFPSDGDMQNIAYPYSQGKPKTEVLNEFFTYADTTFHALKIPISADLFGLTTSSKDDLGIGQNLENALAHFDFVAPMVYPSHYPANFNGYKNPAEKPYEVIFYEMKKAADRAELASTTPSKLRPWLQDFTLRGVEYTPDMVRAQIKATYDSGLTSWMLWNAANHYTVAALEKVGTTTLQN